MSSVSVAQTLSPVTTAGGLYPILSPAIIQLTMPFAYARNMCAPINIAGQPGNTHVWPRQTGSRSMGLAEIAPGALIPMDSTPYGYAGATVFKVAEGFIVTRELIEDTFLPVIQDHMIRFGMRARYKEDKDCLVTFINGASNSNAAVGTSVGATGTVFNAWRTGAIGQADYVINGQLPIGKVNYIPDFVFVNPIQYADTLMLPMFTQQWQYGQAIVRDSGSRVAEGMPNLPLYKITPIQSNAVPAGTVIMLASKNAENPNNQYAPGLFFVEKRPLTVEQEKIPGRDAQAVYFSARYTPSVQKGELLALITGLGTS